jgi:heat shock protein HtpX
MRQLIAKNRRNSWILIFLFLLVIAGLGVLLSYLAGDGGGFFIIAILYGVFSVIGSYYIGDKMVLKSVGAVQIEQKDDTELFQTVENLAITAGIPMPKVYLIPDQALNAFATGRDPEHASVAITQGLRQALTKPELEAVMGHELSHIKHYDIRVMLFTAVLVGMIIFLSDILWRVSLGGGRSNNKKGAGPLILIALVLGLIGAPIAAQLIKLAISRKREFLADAGSAMLTRYPEGMISALQKISQAPKISGHHDSIAHLFIFPPSNKPSLRQRLFSTHPPMEERIAELEKAARIRS